MGLLRIVILALAVYLLWRLARAALSYFAARDQKPHHIHELTPCPTCGTYRELDAPPCERADCPYR